MSTCPWHPGWGTGYDVWAAKEFAMKRWVWLMPVVVVAVAVDGVRGSSSSDGKLVDASRVHVQPGQAAEFNIACRVKADSVDVVIEGDKVVLSIESVRGRGSAAITRKAEHWPEELILR